MGVRLGARGFLGVHFWGLTHECRGRVEVNLQEIAERLFGAFSVRVVGLWFIHTFHYVKFQRLPTVGVRGTRGHAFRVVP